MKAEIICVDGSVCLDVRCSLEGCPKAQSDEIRLAAMLISLASDNIPTDIQELLVRGNPERSIRPNALIRAYWHQRDTTGDPRGEANPAQQGKEEQPMDKLRQAIEVARKKAAVGEQEHWWTIAPAHLTILADAAESTLAKPAPKGWRIVSLDDPSNVWTCFDFDPYMVATMMDLLRDRVAFKVEPL